MEQILRYPLTPVPLSMSHVDGTMQKTPKSKLIQELEKRVASNPHINVDMTIIDGMFFCHLLYQTSIYLCWPGRSFFETSLQTKRDGN